MCVSGRSAVRQDGVQKVYINLESIQVPEEKDKKGTHLTHSST